MASSPQVWVREASAMSSKREYAGAVVRRDGGMNGNYTNPPRAGALTPQARSSRE